MISLGIQIKVLQKGKITIPVEIRKRLALRDGDTLTLEVKEGRLILLPPKTVSNPTDLLIGLAEGVTVEEPVKAELRKAVTRRLERRLSRGS